jgi:hypothetical protein
MVAKKLGEIIQSEQFQKHRISTKGGLRFYHRIVYKPKGYERPRLAENDANFLRSDPTERA